MDEYVVFLHLGDFHLNGESDISDKHLIKIADVLNTYKDKKVINVFIVITGDLTNSGQIYQFNAVKKVIGTIEKRIRDLGFTNIKALIVPGNHDVDQSNNVTELSKLKEGEYDSIVMQEKKKLQNFYNFVKRSRLFLNDETFLCKETIDCEDGKCKIDINLINNAIFSLRDEYKGLLYFPDKEINRATDVPKFEKTFMITLMHHSPEFFRDKIKNKIENEIISKSSILFYGHEHNNAYKISKINGNENVFIQCCGALCKDGNWNGGSFILGILNINDNMYSSLKFKWNDTSKQYEHSNKEDIYIQSLSSEIEICDDFNNEFFDDEFKKGYYVFPSVDRIESKNNILITTFKKLVDEIEKNERIIITGSTSIGKTSLLKNIFLELKKNHIVLFSGAQNLLIKRKNKKSNIDKLIKDIFCDIYGYEESKWQFFEQKERDSLVFIFDDFDQISGIDINLFYNELWEPLKIDSQS